VRSGHGEIDEKTLPPNTLIAFAQKAGATAEDGTSSNSPYTTALLKHLPTPGLDVELALRRVRDEVLQATRNRQEPFKYGSLGGAELPLVPATATSPPTAAPTTQQKLSEAAEAWVAAKDTTSIPVLEDFVARYKSSFYAGLARARIDQLKVVQKNALAALEVEAKRLETPEKQKQGWAEELKTSNEPPNRGMELSPFKGFSPKPEAVDKTLQATPLWRILKRDYPEWYADRVKEITALAAENKDDLAIGQQLARALVALRRQNAGVALAAGFPQLKAVAARMA